MAKLWQKQYSLNELIEQYTVGEDYILDAALVSYDCAASAAHAEMLQTIGILSVDDLVKLKKALKIIRSDFAEGSIEITPSDEDCHTAIENWLTEKTGEAGKKVHTGRSRNDQVVTALRLYLKDNSFSLLQVALALVESLFNFAAVHRTVPMPGRTHMQVAMPSTVGLWAAAFGEALLDDCLILEEVLRVYDKNPLGAAASYGVPLPLDRELVAKKLGFSGVQNNVLYVNNSRGVIEARIAECLEAIMVTLGKMAQDLIIFSMPEFGYFSLPDELCSGSSIMPQKKNPDGLELLRGKVGTVSGYTAQIKNVVRNLFSGYNRDFQETKGPVMRAMKTTWQSLEVMNLTVASLIVHEDALKRGMVPEIYATDEAYNLVKSGKSFRDAYKIIGNDLDRLKKMDPQSVMEQRNYPGAPGNLNLQAPLAVALSMKKRLGEKIEIFHRTLDSVFD